MVYEQAQRESGAGDSAAAQAKEQVQQKAEEVKGQASQRVREQLDTRSTQAGEQASSFAEAVRSAARQLQDDGNDGAAKAVHQAADRLEQLSGYLTGSGSDRFLGDLERLGRQRPWVVGALGATAGFLGARFLKASSESRYDTSARARTDADLPMSRDGNATAALPPMPYPIDRRP